MNRYGVPYKGSKNSIAEWVYSHFPQRENFYDLFAGGCAITQIALMKQKFKRYFANDIDFDGISLFMNAIHGKYQNETRWISRDDFFRLKDSDPYIKYAWSFGNNGRNYLYSKEIEPYKKAWHYAIYFNDFSFAEKLNMNLKSIEKIKDIKDRYSKVKSITKKLNNENLSREISFERQQQLEALNRLQSLQSLQSLQLSSLDFMEVKIYKNSVVYCDIPYLNTDKYAAGGFDHQKFYKWALRQKELVVISEYYMPDDFMCIDMIEKSVLLNSGASQKALEKLFIPKTQKELYKKLLNKKR